MLKKLYTVLIFISFVRCGIEAGKNFRKSKWIDDLVKCVSRDFVEHQVIIIVEGEDSDWSTMIGEIIQRFSQHFPTQYFTYEKIIDLEKSKGSSSISSIMNPDAATLYIPISKSSNLSRLTNIRNAGLDPSNPKPKPKYLMLHLNDVKNFSYNTLLEDSWKERVIDVTLIQIRRSHSRTKNYFLDQQEEDATVHMYNPFNKSYTQQALTSEFNLFPDKARNLHNSEFIMSKQVSNRPKIILFQEELTEYLARSMKFTPVHMPVRKYEDIDDSFKKGAEFHLRQYCIVLSVGSESYLFTKFTDIMSLHAVIPVPPNRSFTIGISCEFVLMILTTILGIYLIRILAKVLKFEDRIWHPLNIIQMILGVSVPDEPRRLAERIVFGTIMLTWMIYSGYLHTVLTTIGLHQDSDHINDLEDLIKSKLVTMIDTAWKKQADSEKDTYLAKLCKKSVVCQDDDIYVTSCIKYLVEHKNVSCLVYNTALKSLIRDNPEIQVIKQSVEYSWLAFFLNPVSPYRDRINQVLSRLVESGLMKKIGGVGGSYVDRDQEEAEEAENLLGMQEILVCVMLIGFSLSLLAFIAEVIIGWLKK